MDSFLLNLSTEPIPSDYRDSSQLLEQIGARGNVDEIMFMFRASSTEMRRWLVDGALRIEDDSHRRHVLTNLLFTGAPRIAATVSTAVRLGRCDDVLWMLDHGWPASATALRIAVEKRDRRCQLYLLGHGAPVRAQELAAVATQMHDSENVSCWATIEPPGKEVLIVALESGNFHVLDQYFRWDIPASLDHIRKQGLFARQVNGEFKNAIRRYYKLSENDRISLRRPEAPPYYKWSLPDMLRAVDRGNIALLEWMRGFDPKTLHKALTQSDALHRGTPRVQRWVKDRAAYILTKPKHNGH